MSRQDVYTSLNSVTLQFDVSERDGGMIAIADSLECGDFTKAFLGDGRDGFDFTQTPFTNFGSIYPSFVVQIDEDILLEHSLRDIKEAISEQIRRIVTAAYAYSPDPEEANLSAYGNYWRQRAAVMTHPDNNAAPDEADQNQHPFLMAA